MALSASASWSWAGVYCGRVKVNSGIFESTKVLKDASPPPHKQAQISQPRVLRLYLLVGFPVFVGYLPFGDPNSASMLPFQIPIQHLSQDFFFVFNILSIGYQKISLFI